MQVSAMQLSCMFAIAPNTNANNVNLVLPVVLAAVRG
jgi:hypothetical protein